MGRRLARFRRSSPCSEGNRPVSVPQSDIEIRPTYKTHTKQSLNQKDENFEQVLNKAWRASHEKRVWVWIQEKHLPLNSRISRKSSEQQKGPIVGTTPVCSPVLESSGVSSGPCKGHQNVDLKQIECEIFLKQRCLFGISNELQFGFRSHGKPCAISLTAKNRDAFIERKGSWEGWSKQRVHQRNWEPRVLWLFTGWVVTVCHSGAPDRQEEQVSLTPVGLC